MAVLVVCWIARIILRLSDMAVSSRSFDSQNTCTTQHHHPKAKAIPVFRHLVTAISIARQGKARQDDARQRSSASQAVAAYTTTLHNNKILPRSLLVVATRKAVRSAIRSAAQAGRTNAVRWELAVRRQSVRARRRCSHLPAQPV